MRYYLTIVLFVSALQSVAFPSDSVNRKKATLLYIGIPVVHVSSIVLFDQLWYKDQPREKFHFFNDGREWNQMDKVGHFYSSYHLTTMSSRLFLWARYPSKKSDLLAVGTSTLFMTTVEVLDGFSSEFGSSPWDMAANFAGIGFYLAQKSIWNEIRITPKYSYSPTQFPEMRPEILGKNFVQQIFKDYNGQTYWFSFDIYAFLPKGNSFPKWLNIAIGYGSYNMLYGEKALNESAGYNSFRQYYLALDLDLSHIKTRNPIVNSLLYFINRIHIPAPTLEVNTNHQVKGYILTF